MELICTSTRGHGSVELDQLNKGRQTVNFTLHVWRVIAVVLRTDRLALRESNLTEDAIFPKICSYNNFTDIYTNTAQRRMNVYTQSGTTYT